MTKNILFLVTGMTPQIITETVWALACDPEREEKWIPDEIHVMSTEQGLNQIRDRLFNKGNFQKLLNEYQLTDVHFDESCLHAICSNGEPLADLKTPEDNELAADSICRKIREFTEDEQTSLHVSIAGGRKTMGFYAGYALSLYGRSQDRMSHVLVSDSFETIPDFYYPTAKAGTFVTDRNGKAWDAKDAKVWLAEIAFVRMKEAIKDKHQLRSKDNFSQVVEKINQSFNDVQLSINPNDRTIVVNKTYTLDLPPREFAMLHWFADRRMTGQEGITAPTKKINSKDADAADVQYISQLTEAFKQYYLGFKFDAEDVQVDVDKQFFDNVKSLLKTALENQLGLELAAKIAIVQKDQKRGTPFYLDLPATQIEIVDSFKGKF